MDIIVGIALLYLVVVLVLDFFGVTSDGSDGAADETEAETNNQFGQSSNSYD